MENSNKAEAIEEETDEERQSWRRCFPTMSDGLLDMLLAEIKAEQLERFRSIQVRARKGLKIRLRSFGN